MVRKDDIVSPSARDQAKIDTLRPILRFHDREGLELRIIRLNVAWVGFLDGAAIVISQCALNILSADELQAVIAHELGHEYFEDEYYAARREDRYDAVKEIELRCDAVSIITLHELGLDPRSLTSGVSKISAFNQLHGIANDSHLGVFLPDRLKFCKAMMKNVDAIASTQTASAQ